MGIKGQYPDNWQLVPFGDCIEPITMCGVGLKIVDPSFNPSYSAGIFVVNLKSPIGDTAACNCSKLSDFVKWDTSRMSESGIMNENETTIGSNHSAWQMELSKGLDKGYDLVVRAIDKNLGYIFTYSYENAGSNSPYKYLKDFKQLLKTVEFTKDNSSEQTAGSMITKESNVILPSTDNLNSQTIKVLSMSSFLDNAGYFHVVGEIENNTPDAANFVKATGTFYDSNNQVVATDFTYTSPSDLAPGDKAPFEIILTSASIPLSQIDNYRVIPSSQ